MNLRETSARIGLSILAVGAITACSESQQATPPTLPAISEPTRILPTSTFLPTLRPLTPTPFPTITPRPPVTPTPERTPMPSPTRTKENTPLPKTNIEIARMAQLEAFEKGQFRLLLPEELRNNGFIDMLQFFDKEIGGTSLAFRGFPTKQKVNFPSLMDAVVLDTTEDHPLANKILMQRGDHIVEVLFIKSGQIRVAAGDVIQLGQPIFSFQYDKNDSSQKDFTKLDIKNKEGNVARDVVVVLRHGLNIHGQIQTQNFSFIDNFLYERQGKAMTIPTNPSN